MFKFGADLASLLNDGNQLRILPIVGHGSLQNVEDILYLQGVDLGIVRADTFDYLEKTGPGEKSRASNSPMSPSSITRR